MGYGLWVMGYCMARNPIPITYYLLPITHCLLPIAYCLLPIAYCPPPITHFLTNNKSLINKSFLILKTPY